MSQKPGAKWRLQASASLGLQTSQYDGMTFTTVEFWSNAWCKPGSGIMHWIGWLFLYLCILRKIFKESWDIPHHVISLANPQPPPFLTLNEYQDSQWHPLETPPRWVPVPGCLPESVQKRLNWRPVICPLCRSVGSRHVLPKGELDGC